MTIKRKVALFVIVVVALTAIQTVISIANLKGFESESINGVGMSCLVAHVCGAGVAANDYFLTGKEEYIDRVSTELNGLDKRIAEVSQVGGDVAQQLKDVSTLVSQYREIFRRAVAEMRATGKTSLKVELIKKNDQIIGGLHKASDMVEERISKVARNSTLVQSPVP